MRRCILALLPLLAHAHGLLAQEAQRLARAEPGFEILLPHGWRVLPDSVLEALQRDPKDADIVLAPGQRLVLGMIPEEAQVADIARIPHPFLLIRTDRTHRLSRSTLRMIPTSRAPLPHDLLEPLRGDGILAPSRVTWDEEAEAAFSTFRLSGDREAIQAVTPFREGLLLTTYYQEQNAYPAPAVIGFVSEFLIGLRWTRELDPDAFEPGPARSRLQAVRWSASHVAGALGVGFLIGFLVGAELGRRKGRPRA